MLDRLSDALRIANWVPALFVEEGSHTFQLIRVMFAVILLVVIVYGLTFLRRR